MHKNEWKRTTTKIQSYHFLSNAITIDKGILKNLVIGTYISISFCREKYNQTL